MSDAIEVLVRQKNEWRERAETAERERDEARRELAVVTQERNVLRHTEDLAMKRLRTRAERAEAVVEAAKAYEKWMGKWHDYSKKSGLSVSKPQTALIAAVRALDAAEGTQGAE